MPTPRGARDDGGSSIATVEPAEQAAREYDREREMKILFPRVHEVPCFVLLPPACGDASLPSVLWQEGSCSALTGHRCLEIFTVESSSG